MAATDNPTEFNSATQSPPVRTQFLIFTLFGEYVLDRCSTIWTADLLYLMELLGVSERAIRSALSRMTRKGWIRTQRAGRHSQVMLTERGQVLLQKGRRRIFEPICTDWDGQWHLVVYSLPEKNRRRRHVLRTQLSWLGFGHLAPGIWLSPRSRSAEELERLSEELGITAYMEMFASTYLGPSSNEDLVHRCWDLEGLATQYKTFIDRFQPEYQKILTRRDENQSLDPEDCFVRRFWLTHEFKSFPLKDPNLPTMLLPSDWVGLTARRLFDEYHQLLEILTDQFIDDVLNGNMTSSHG